MSLSRLAVCSSRLLCTRSGCFRMNNFTIPIRSINSHVDPNKAVQDKLLFTPGPLTTSWSVKSAMMKDLGSRDSSFVNIVKQVRAGLLKLANVNHSEYVCIPIQGSGTYGVESVISSVIGKKGGGLLVVANGAYGRRIASMAKAHGIPTELYSIADNIPPSIKDVEHLLKTTAAKVTHVAMVHSETTSGIINDITSMGRLVHKYNKSYIVDGMSSFGAVPIHFESSHIDYLVSSANKCIEGVPGFAFVIAKRSALAAVPTDTPDTLALNLIAQLAGLEKDGQFRFTPPTHPLLAFAVALAELEDEGGVEKRMMRYKENQSIVMKGLKQLGFQLYLPSELQGHIISGYHYPQDSNWSFETFYSKLNDRGFVIYPGKVSDADCFRIGHIGRIFPKDSQALVDAIQLVCQEMKINKYHH